MATNIVGKAKKKPMRAGDHEHLMAPNVVSPEVVGKSLETKESVHKDYLLGYFGELYHVLFGGDIYKSNNGGSLSYLVSNEKDVQIAMGIIPCRFGSSSFSNRRIAFELFDFGINGVSDYVRIYALNDKKYDFKYYFGDKFFEGLDTSRKVGEKEYGIINFNEKEKAVPSRSNDGILLELLKEVDGYWNDLLDSKHTYQYGRNLTDCKVVRLTALSAYWDKLFSKYLEKGLF